MAKFEPKFSITNTIANNLLEIERVKEGIKSLPINQKLLNSLRETAKLSTIHYSTQIEGNRLTKEEVKDLIDKCVPRSAVAHSSKKSRFKYRQST